jgi:general stress protein 26
MPDSPTRNEAIRKLAQLIKDVRVAMLTTTTDRGWLRSRPMVTQRVAFDGDLWFLSGKSTAKARDVRNRQQVDVAYMSSEEDRYVSVSGIATIVDDPGKAKALWNSSYAEWFPKGVADPDLVLIKVQVEEAEYWDPAQHRMIQITGFVEPPASFREPGIGV